MALAVWIRPVKPSSSMKAASRHRSISSRTSISRTTRRTARASNSHSAVPACARSASRPDASIFSGQQVGSAGSNAIRHHGGPTAPPSPRFRRALRSTARGCSTEARCRKVMSISPNTSRRIPTRSSIITMVMPASAPASFRARVPAAAAARFVAPDAPYYLNGSGLEVRNVDSDLTLVGLYAAATYYGERWRLGGGGRWEEEIKNYEVAPDPLTRLLEDDPSRTGNLSTRCSSLRCLAGYRHHSRQGDCEFRMVPHRRPPDVLRVPADRVDRAGHRHHPARQSQSHRNQHREHRSGPGLRDAMGIFRQGLGIPQATRRSRSSWSSASIWGKTSTPM